eukprot:COSAG02_NODE_1499_length_12268_cov_12.941984_11_plen_151_part_00
MRSRGIRGVAEFEESRNSRSRGIRGVAEGEESRNSRSRGGGGVAEFEESRRGRSRGGGGVAALEGSRKGWATPAATRLRFKTESRGGTAINSAFVTAVNALPQASKFNPTVPAATATGPLIASISLEASTEVAGQYRVDFAYTNWQYQAV